MTANPLPLTKTESPTSASDVAAIICDCASTKTALYPIGGGTALDYGLPAKTPGIGLSLAGLSRVIDYPARDMTITLEAGVRMSELQKLLAGEGQRLPIDTPHVEQATIGGVVATATSGARRYANGTLRDYVIGVSAVDGRGTAFKAGGRVVKNVAGYDFCKLLTGSLGTLAVITQVTLKVKPLPQRSAFVAVPCCDLEQAASLLEIMAKSRTAPAAIEILIGSAWKGDPALGDLRPGDHGFLVVGIEGTEPEVRWMITTAIDELRAGASDSASVGPREISANETAALWNRLTDFPTIGEAPMVLKVCVPPSQTIAMIALLLAADPRCSIQAHAGNGVVLARFTEFPPAAISKVLIGSLQPAALALGGSVTVLRCTNAGDLTHQAAWGGLGDSAMLMEAVKRQFDPHGLFNPGRFVYQAQ
jgi:glycolate oxidase FAD binding subunit